MCPTFKFQYSCTMQSSSLQFNQSPNLINFSMFFLAYISSSYLREYKECLEPQLLIWMPIRWVVYLYSVLQMFCLKHKCVINTFFKHKHKITEYKVHQRGWKLWRVDSSIILWSKRLLSQSNKINLSCSSIMWLHVKILLQCIPGLQGWESRISPHNPI